MKKVLAVVLTLMLVLSLAACGNNNNSSGGNSSGDSSSGGSDSAASEGDDTTSDDGTVYKFTFACEDASTAPAAGVWDAYIERVKEMSGGRIQIEAYYGGVLGASSEQTNMVESGAVDLTHAAPGHMPGRYPMTEIFAAPGLKYESAWQCGKALEYLYENSKYSYMKDETSNMKILGFKANNRAPIAHKGSPWTSPDDMKGVNINASNTPTNSMTSALGMNQVTIGFTERYEGIQKGTIDACTSDYLALEAFSMYDVVDSVLDTSIACQCSFLAMNLDAWNSLPEDLQKVMEDAADSLVDDFYVIFKDVENRAYDLAAEKNVEIYQPNEAVQAALDEAFEAGSQAWIDERTAQGYDAQGFWDEVQAALDMFADQIPEV